MNQLKIKPIIMKKIFTLLIICLLFSLHSFAQDKTCGTMENLELRKQKDPQLEKRMQDIEKFTKSKVSDFEQNQQKIVGNVITIPVVVHVLYRNSTENISVAQIQSQLDVLNEDFRRTNPDANNIWSQAADTEIEFCLSTVDPNGNATTGITRKQTTRQDWGANDDAKRSSSGGIDPWNTAEYLNMWVVPKMTTVSGGQTINLLGYAQFPGGSAATDGLVMIYNAFGRTGAVTAPYDGGRTTTHEIGHYLNLRHIWGDANCGNDFVSDTPTHQTSNRGCPVGQVSCSSTDMPQNYMDYTNDSCMNLFTQGQKNRMRAVLAAGGPRRSLALSDKCGAVVQPTCNDGVQNGNETGVDCGGSCTPCQTGNQYCASQGNSVADEYISNVKLGSINNNSGAQSYSNFTSISTSLTKGSSYTLSVTPTWTGTTYSEGYAAWIDFNQDGDFNDAGEQIFSRAASQTSPVTGTISIPATALNGTTRVRVSMKYNGVPTSCETFDYGEVEDYTVNITSSGTGGSSCSNTVSSFPYNEGFESGFGAWTQATNDDFNWTRQSGSTASSNTGPTSASQGSQYIYMESSAPNNNVSRAIIESPCYNLSGVSQGRFTFKYHMYGASNMGNLKLAVSTNNGSSWTTIWTRTGNQGNAWLDADVDLSAYSSSTIKLRFDGTTGTTWQGDMAVDAIALTNAPADKCAGVSPYNSSTSYSVGDRVTYQGSLYERTSTGWINLGTCGTPRVDNSRTEVATLEAIEFNIYPNPVKGNTLYIKSNIENVPFKVVNMLGQQVARGTTSNQSLNVSNLEAGMYLIQFDTADGLITKKFLKE